MEKRRRSAREIISACISIVIIAALLLFIILQVFFPTAVIKVFGFKPYLTSNTGSMEPMMKYNDFIIVKHADFNKMQEGDIIAFISTVGIDGKVQDVPIIHQVVEVIPAENGQPHNLRTRGINAATNPNPDLRLVTIDGANATNTFVGQYAFTIPLLGYVIAFLKSPFGLATVAVNLLVIIMITRIIKGSDDSDPEQQEADSD